MASLAEADARTARVTQVGVYHTLDESSIFIIPRMRIIFSLAAAPPA